MTLTIRPGRADPLGATFDGSGVNFAVFSQHATAVELCLFDAYGAETRGFLPERSAHVFHGYVPGLRPGQRYGFRVHGPYDPGKGHRFNPHKLLVDPYARAIDGKANYKAPIYGFRPFAGAFDFVMDTEDDGWGVPKGVVVEDRFDWRGDRPPHVPWNETILYEVHVKGFTQLHPDVPSELRGKYLGLASDPAIEHLRALGVTTLELLPVHEIFDEPAVARRGMTNYWGYSTLGFFAPEQRYARERGQQVREFKEMVRRLHAAGIEVVLDVVYNHTCEGDHLGPTVSLRGFDNLSYYTLRESDLHLYVDTTGCGNSLNMKHPQTLKLIMDSLRYWVTEMHVDGFRFDLATTLGREDSEYDPTSAFFDIVHQDPVLSRVKLIAEPWDLGENGYRVGQFPVAFSEWNAKYRDTVRRFWTGDPGTVGDLGFRLTGSSDLFAHNGRRAHASINFVTAHDGFTLNDLVTYEKKRNLANGEQNKDGWDHNMAWNSGVEGETKDEAVRAFRARRVRNFLATLMFSQGVPMLVAGDEMRRTQLGNNNAYCQDNEISWLSWDLDGEPRELLEFTRRLVQLRKAHPVFRRRDFFRGTPVRGSRSKDIVWFRRDGEEMTLSDWTLPREPFLALLLAGDALDLVDDHGLHVQDDTFYVVLSASHQALTFRLPSAGWGERWELLVDTRESTIPARGGPFVAGDEVTFAPHTLALFVRVGRPSVPSWRAVGNVGG